MYLFCCCNENLETPRESPNAYFRVAFSTYLHSSSSNYAHWVRNFPTTVPAFIKIFLILSQVFESGRQPTSATIWWLSTTCTRSEKARSTSTISVLGTELHTSKLLSITIKCLISGRQYRTRATTLISVEEGRHGLL